MHFIFFLFHGRSLTVCEIFSCVLVGLPIFRERDSTCDISLLVKYAKALRNSNFVRNMISTVTVNICRNDLTRFNVF